METVKVALREGVRRRAAVKRLDGNSPHATTISDEFGTEKPLLILTL